MNRCLMRLDIDGRFIVGIARSNGGWSKGRPIAYLEEGDQCRPIDLLIPNDLDDAGIERFVSDKYAAFAHPQRRIRRV
jgi:hypothetical protein